MNIRKQIQVLLEITYKEMMNRSGQSETKEPTNYSQEEIIHLDYHPVTHKIYDEIQFEGIDEEWDIYDMHDFEYAIYPIPEEDAIGLKNSSEETMNKYNRFDIFIKDSGLWDQKYVDMIDYEKGIVYIVRVKQHKEN